MSDAFMDKSIFSTEQRALQNALRQIRIGLGLRQEDLAALLDEPQSFVSKYESGERRLDLVELRQICTAMNVSLLDLIKRFEEQIRLCSQEKSSSDFPKNSGQTSVPSAKRSDTPNG
jgi:transcriptional regulator with XRE-family HTH domain